MLVLLFPCHGKWNLQIHCPFPYPLVFILTVQQLHADNVSVAYLLPGLLPSLMPPFLRKCSMAFVSLTLACFLQVEKQNFITEELIHGEHLFR